MTAEPPGTGEDGAMSITLADARLVTPDGVHEGWLTIEDGRITHVGRGPAPGPGHGLTGRYVVPGFVDIHSHGGAGGSFPSGDPDEASRVAALHARHGTTTLMASLVTASLDDLARAASALADLCDDGLLAGIHFEGPYISRARCGAHNPALLREPSPQELSGLLKAGRGHVRMLTVAAELPGAPDTTGVPIRLWNAIPAAIARISGLSETSPVAFLAAKASAPMPAVRSTPGNMLWTASRQMQNFWTAERR